MTTQQKIYTDDDLQDRIAAVRRDAKPSTSDSTGADSFLDDLVEAEKEETDGALDAFGLSSDDKSGDAFEYAVSISHNGRSPEIEEAANTGSGGHSDDLEAISSADLAIGGHSPTIELASSIGDDDAPPITPENPEDATTGYAFEDNTIEDIIESDRRYPGDDAQLINLSGAPTDTLRAGFDADDDYGSVIAEGARDTHTEDSFDVMMDKANVDNDVLVDFEDALEEEDIDLLADPPKKSDGGVSAGQAASHLGTELSSKLSGLLKGKNNRYRSTKKAGTPRETPQTQRKQNIEDPYGNKIPIEDDPRYKSQSEESSEPEEGDVVEGSIAPDNGESPQHGPPVPEDFNPPKQERSSPQPLDLSDAPEQKSPELDLSGTSNQKSSGINLGDDLAQESTIKQSIKDKKSKFPWKKKEKSKKSRGRFI